MYVFSTQSGEILNSNCLKKESKHKFTQEGLRFVDSSHLVYITFTSSEASSDFECLYHL